MAKKITILTTGGTVAGLKSGLSSIYESAKLGFDEIFPPALQKRVKESLGIEINVQNVFNIGSQDMDNAHLLNLAKAAQSASENCDGVVILHGTDSIEESAYFLNLVLKTSANVVLTGAMHTSDSLIFDGAINIYDALILASSDEVQNMGVLGVFDGRIYSARGLIKTHTRNVGAFDGTNSGQIGIIADNKANFILKSAKAHTLNTPFDIKNIQSLAKVDVVYICADFNEKLYDFSKSDGLVLCAMGNANMPKNALETLKALNIPKVRTSRANIVDISKDGEIDDDAFNFIRANDLGASKARILLMCALSISKEREILQSYFDRF